MFNALKYTKSLEKNGFDREQAEALVSLFMQMLEFNMVYKSDFEQFKNEVYNRFEIIDNKFDRIDERFDRIDERFDRMDYRISSLESNQNNKFEEMYNKLSLQLTVKLGIMLAVSVGLISTIISLKF